MRIGVLGTGQLAYLLGLASQHSEQVVVPYGPKSIKILEDATQPMYGDFSDLDSLKAFLTSIDVLTYETESIALDVLDYCAEYVEIWPGREALKIAQDRFLEKSLFRELSIPTNNFFAISASDDLQKAVDSIGFPAILKTRKDGYDGKGQFRIADEASLGKAWETLGKVPCILESLVPFEREVSIIATRDQHNNIAFFPLTQNIHQDGILRFSYPLESDSLQKKAEDYAASIMKRLDYVGCLAIEFFELDGELFTNEMAPRVHNSGHWTLEGATMSQFAMHLKAISGQRISQTSIAQNLIMVNVIGKVVDQNIFKDVNGLVFHDYGKTLKPNRKMGHFTISQSNSGPSAFELVSKIYSALGEDELAQQVLLHSF